VTLDIRAPRHTILGVVPELPEVEAVRRHLAPFMTDARFDAVELHRADLRQPFPERFKARLTGQTVLALTRRAKYLLAALSSHETLLMHLGMSGSFRIIENVGEDDPEAAFQCAPHDHVVFHMSSPATRAIIAFNDPRRFGVMDLVPQAALEHHAGLSALGPEPLSAEFDGLALARACRAKKTSLKAALLDQRVVAGLGNIYVSEALYLARLSPFRRASTIATPSGLPRAAADHLAGAIKQVLVEAIERQSITTYRGSRFRVYDREDERCRRRTCVGTIKRRTQAGRSTFYCPVCQR